LVQMYTNTTDTPKTITITKLEAVYPSQTVTGVLLDASKAYMSTQGKGNFTFEILKNGAKPGSSNPIDGEDSLEPKKTAKLKTADLDAVTQSTRLSGPGAKLSRQGGAPNMSDEVLGRKFKG